MTGSLHEERQQRSRGIFRSGLVGITTRLIGAAVGFAMTPVLTHSLGQDSYGVFASITGIAIFLAFSDLGVGQGMVSRFASAAGDDPIALQRGLVSNTLTIMFGMATVLLPLGIISAFVLPWPRLLNSGLAADDLRPAIAVYLALSFVNVPCGLGQRIMQAQQRGTEVNLWIFGSTVVGTCGAATLAVAGAPLWVLVGVALAVNAVAGGLQTWTVFRREPSLRPRRADLRAALLGSLVRSGSLYLILNLVVAFAYQADIFVVSYVMGAVHAAVFAVSNKVFSLFLQLIQSYFLQLWPAVAEANAKGDGHWITVTVWKSVRNVILVAGPLLLIAVLLVRPLVAVVFGPSYIPTWSLAIGLGIWTLQQGIGQPFAMLLNGTSTVTFQVVISVLMGAANLALSIVLVNLIGVSGAVWGSVISHAVLLLAPSVVYVAKYLPRRMNWVSREVR